MGELCFQTVLKDAIAAYLLIFKCNWWLIVCWINWYVKSSFDSCKSSSSAEKKRDESLIQNQAVDLFFLSVYDSLKSVLIKN